MSTFQAKNRSISAVPRLVMDQTWSRPGTVLTASSSGRGDRDQHLVDGKDAVIDADHDAREIGLREHRHRDGERQVDAHGHQRQDHEDDGLAVAGRPVRRVRGRRDRWKCRKVAHLASASPRPAALGAFVVARPHPLPRAVMTFTLALSSTPRPPTITTSSPGRTPFRICTLSPSRTPTSTLLGAPRNRQPPPARPCRLLRPGEWRPPAPPVALRTSSVTIAACTLAPGLRRSPGFSGLHPNLHGGAGGVGGGAHHNHFALHLLAAIHLRDGGGLSDLDDGGLALRNIDARHHRARCPLP